MSILPIAKIKEQVKTKPFYIDDNKKEYDLNTDLYRKEIETDIIYFSLRMDIFFAFINALNKYQSNSNINAQDMYDKFSSRLLNSITNEIDTDNFYSNILKEIYKTKNIQNNKGQRTLTVIRNITGKEGTTIYKVKGTTSDSFIGILILSTNVKGGGYQAFSSFLRRKIKKLGDDDNMIVPKELRIKTENSEDTRRGFDFAHVLMGELSSSAGSNTPISKLLDQVRAQVDNLDDDAKSNIAKATKRLQDFHNDQYNALLQKRGSSDDVDITLEYNFLRNLTSNDISGVIGISILIPEFFKDNTRLGLLEKSTIEAGIKKAVIESIEKDKTLIDKFLTIRTSPSLTDKIEQGLIDTLLVGKLPKDWQRKSKKYTTDIPIEINNKKTKKTKIPRPKKLTGVVKDSSSISATKTAPIRNISGQFTSLPKILAMLQGNINQQVASNMGSPRLNYRKGRFANSVRINNVNRSDKGQWTITYSYMTYPYQTFEPGYAQGSNARDPRALITLSIRELVAKEIGNKFRAVRIGGAGSLGRIK
jgi:hypothetical protein